MSLTKRVEVLFEPDEHQRLERLARDRRESVGAVIREAVRRECLVPDLERRQAAVERLLSYQFDLPDWEVLKEEMSRSIAEHIERTLEAP